MRQNLRKTFLLLIFCANLLNLKAQTSCSITCPSNITTIATSSSGAVVNYTVLTSGDCGNITSLPASGSTFPIGTTTVNVYHNASEVVYGLVQNTLVTFNISSPSVFSTPLAITGLQTGESMRSIDFRPANNLLYGIGAVVTGAGTVGRLYQINLTTGAATQIGGTFPLPPVTFFATSLETAMDFDPTTDRIRLVTENNVNMRLHPDQGTYITDGSINPSGRGVCAVAHSNNVPNATSSVLYDIGFDDRIPVPRNVLYTQDPNKGDLTQVGFTSISTFLSEKFGFDISQTGTALASFSNGLYRINLSTGAATLVGNLSSAIDDLSIAPAGFTVPSCSFIVTVTPPPPTVTINKAATQFDPTTSAPVKFTVEFNEAVTGFDASDISFAGSTVPGTLVPTVTGSGTTYTVSVNGFTGGGNIVASINAGAAINNNGIANLASTSTDNVVAVVLVTHDIFVVKRAQAPVIAAGGAIIYEIDIVRPSFGGPVQNVVITDVLPAGARFLQFTPLSTAPFQILSLPIPGQNGTISLLFPFFNPGQVFSFRVLVATDPSVTGSIINTATISGPLGDVNPANNSATATVQIAVAPTITCPSDVTIYVSSETCVAEYTFTPALFTKTGFPDPVISLTASSGQVTVLPAELTSSGRTVFIPKGNYVVTATATNAGGTAQCTYTLTVADNTPPAVTCQQDINVAADPGKCSAKVNLRFQVSENCSLPISYNIDGSIGTWNFTNVSAGFEKTYAVGTRSINAVFTDADGNTTTCTFQVTIVDNEQPVITSKPSDVTVECASQIPAVNTATVVATDNCGSATITHVSDVISNQLCANKYTVTRTYKATDEAGNTTTAVQLITVDDKTPPTITGLTPSKRILAPPNHKMVPITLDYTVSDNCLSDPDVTINITSNEPVNGTGDGDTDPDWEVIDDHHIKLRAERSAQGAGRIYTITVTVNDGCNAPVSATTEVRVAHNITAPQSGNSFKVGSTVSFAGEFWDVPGNTHSAKWMIDGSTTAKGIVTEPSGNKNGKVTGSYRFTAPGIYKLQMNTTDQKGVTTYANTNGDIDAIVVIYDPNGGHTYGGGYFNSPAGALTGNSSATGKASYGFAMNYFKNSTNPKGETQFEFKVGEFEFNALNFEYLVISNWMAQFKGTGKIIGGQSGIAFTMTVVDGQLDGSGIDKIRMKIYNKNNGKIIYDNQPGASDAALPTQAVGANSTVVISGTNTNPVTTKTASSYFESENKSNRITQLAATVYPNPSAHYFNIIIHSNDLKERIDIQVIDMYGRVLEVINVAANSTIRLGDRYRPGTYFVRITQGKQTKQLELIRLSE